jgi:glycosyltransferase involved in cell wall biosynthesis
MKISIITPTYNSAKTISRTIDSIILQSYKDIEYIVIDGDSTDGTQDIVLNFKDKINLKLISEKDSGIYDAMNKGIGIAGGDVIGILNSDDFYKDESVLSEVMQAFVDIQIDAVYGDISYFGPDVNKITRYWKAGEYKESNLNSGWVIPHPALFVRKSVYKKYGLYNINLKIAADYEFILRILKIYKIKVKYIPKILVRMYDGGTSASSIKHRIQGWKELENSWKINNLLPHKFFIIRRVLYKVSQYFI